MKCIISVFYSYDTAVMYMQVINFTWPRHSRDTPLPCTTAIPQANLCCRSTPTHDNTATGSRSPPAMMSPIGAAAAALLLSTGRCVFARGSLLIHGNEVTASSFTFFWVHTCVVGSTKIARTTYWRFCLASLYSIKRHKSYETTSKNVQRYKRHSSCRSLVQIIYLRC